MDADQDSDISRQRRRGKNAKCMEHGAKGEQKTSIRTLCALLFATTRLRLSIFYDFNSFS